MTAPAHRTCTGCNKVTIRADRLYCDPCKRAIELSESLARVGVTPRAIAVEYIALKGGRDD